MPEDDTALGGDRRSPDDYARVLRMGAAPWNALRQVEQGRFTWLTGVHLPNVKLSGANLRDVDLSDVVLRGADLREADFTGAALTRTNLVGATLRGAILVDVEVSGADLTGADLAEAVCENWRWDDPPVWSAQTILPEGFSPPQRQHEISPEHVVSARVHAPVGVTATALVTPVRPFQTRVDVIDAGRRASLAELEVLLAAVQTILDDGPLGRFGPDELAELQSLHTVLAAALRSPNPVPIIIERAAAGMFAIVGPSSADTAELAEQLEQAGVPHLDAEAAATEVASAIRAAAELGKESASEDVDVANQAAVHLFNAVRRVGNTSAAAADHPDQVPDQRPAARDRLREAFIEGMEKFLSERTPGIADDGIRSGAKLLSRALLAIASAATVTGVAADRHSVPWGSCFPDCAACYEGCSADGESLYICRE